MARFEGRATTKLSPPSHRSAAARDFASRVHGSSGLTPEDDGGGWLVAALWLEPPSAPYGAKLDLAFTPQWPSSQVTTYMESKPPMTLPSLR